MKDLKLAITALVLFVAFPLITRPLSPSPYLPLTKPVNHDYLKEHKLDPKDKKDNKVEATICWSAARWCVYGNWGCYEPHLPYRCTGEGFGGGGGNAF